MYKLENDYQDILKEAMLLGFDRQDRTGVGCKSIFNKQLSWNLSRGYFPLITGRRIFPKVFNTEWDWFSNGETNIKRFQENNVTIWDAWADENGDLGPVYGHQMRNFNDQGVDQLKRLIWSLNNIRDSRRHIISLWNPAQISEMALPPCYLYFQFFVDHNEKLNMFVVQRSGDLFLGIPYDLALFSRLLLYVAAETRHIPGKIDLQIVDAHVYRNQKDAILEYLSQPIFDQPTYDYKEDKLIINDYKHGPHITAPVAV